MWGLAVGFVALLAAAGVYDWRVRRRRGATSVDGAAARNARIRDEGRAGHHNPLGDTYNPGSS